MMPTTAIRLPAAARPAQKRRGSPARTALIVLVVVVLLATSSLLILPQPLAALGATGSILGTLLPWSAALLLPTAVLGLAARSRRIMVAALMLALTWTVIFVPALTAQLDPAAAELSIITENLHSENEDPAATARSLAARNPTVIALQELTPRAADAVSDTLAEHYPHVYRVGSVGVWSTRPLSDGSPLALGLDWNRALRVDVGTDLGAVRLYVVHAASLRAGGDDDREGMLAALGSELADDDSHRILVAGDLNGGSLDPLVAPLRARVNEAADLRPTWPADAPVVRLDHVLVRGFDAAGSVLPANGSDHLGVEVLLRGR